MNIINFLVDYIFLGTLVFMSITSFGIAMERWVYYGKIELTDFKTKRQLEINLTQRLHLIATIGSNAPYVGLLGTVIGIMGTFYEMGQNSELNPGDIMSGLAMALKVTAAGLGVAIPAVVLYNLLLRKIKVLIFDWEFTQEFGKEEGHDG